MFFPRLLKTEFDHPVCCNVHAFVFVIECAEACLFCVVEKQDGLTMALLQSW